jgi:hypothetical protein
MGAFSKSAKVVLGQLARADHIHHPSTRTVAETFLQGLLEIERKMFCAGIVPFESNLYTMKRMQAVPQWVVDVTPTYFARTYIQLYTRTLVLP